MKQIVLLTDFGLNDLYVGILKGVIQRISPETHITDLTHSIQPQNIKQAAYLLNNSYVYFEDGTIFLSIVDPGVGANRRAIAVQTDKYYLIAPDNGILSFILDHENIINAVELTNEKYHLMNLSNTFHGRDIFAPVAAYLSNGVDFKELGNKIEPDSIIRLQPLKFEIENNNIKGEVIYSDIFGNLITSIPSSSINCDFSKAEIKIGEYTISGISKTYSDVYNEELIAYIGSFGYLELGINLGSLSKKMNYIIGDDCNVYLKLVK